MKKTAPTPSSYRYKSFLIRMWQEENGVQWKGAVKHVLTGKQMFFGDLESLFIYLLEQTKAKTS